MVLKLYIGYFKIYINNPVTGKEDIVELTIEEKKAIKSIQRVAKNWPDSLWLFSGSGTLWIMKRGPNGEQMLDSDGCVDPDYNTGEQVEISNDGGDW